MAPPTPRLVVPIDLTKKPWEQKFPLHNRWHPQIPPVAEVKAGEVFRVEMSDWTGGVIKDDSSALDIKFIDLSTVSMNFNLSTDQEKLTNSRGDCCHQPDSWDWHINNLWASNIFWVKGNDYGLEINWLRCITSAGRSELSTRMGYRPSRGIFWQLRYWTWVLFLEMNGALQHHLTEKMEVASWLTIFPPQPKLFGILKEYMPTLLTYQVKFSKYSYITRRRKWGRCITYFVLCLAGVRFPGLTHPGVVGTAPSMELLNIWNERERELEENGLQNFKLCEVLHSRPLANLPTTKGCLLGKVLSYTECSWEYRSDNERTFNNSMCQLSWSCRLKGAPLNGKRLLGKLQEQFQEERMAEIVISKTSVEVQKYTFQSL